VIECERPGPAFPAPDELRPNDVKIVALQERPLFRPNVEPHQVFLEPREILHAHPRRRVRLAVGQYEVSAIRLPACYGLFFDAGCTRVGTLNRSRSRVGRPSEDRGAGGGTQTRTEVIFLTVTSPTERQVLPPDDFRSVRRAAAVLWYGDRLSRENASCARPSIDWQPRATVSSIV